MRLFIRAPRFLAPLLALTILLALAGCAGGAYRVTTSPTATGCPEETFTAIYGQLSQNIPQRVSFEITSSIQASVNGAPVSYQQHGQGSFNTAAGVFQMNLATGDTKGSRFIEMTTPAGTNMALTGQSSADVGRGAFTSGVGIDLDDPLNYRQFHPASVSCSSLTVNGDPIQVWDLRGPVASRLSITGVGPGGQATEDLYVSTGNSAAPTAPAKYFPVQMDIRVDSDPGGQFVSLVYSGWSKQRASVPTGAGAYAASFRHARTAAAPSIVRHWTVTSTSYGTDLTVTSTSSDATPTPTTGLADTRGISSCASGCGHVPLSAIHPLTAPDDGNDDPVVTALVNEVGPLMDELDTCSRQTSYLSIWGWYPDIKWVNSAC